MSKAPVTRRNASKDGESFADIYKAIESSSRSDKLGPKFPGDNFEFEFSLLEMLRKERNQGLDRNSSPWIRLTGLRTSSQSNPPTSDGSQSMSEDSSFCLSDSAGMGNNCGSPMDADGDLFSSNSSSLSTSSNSSSLSTSSNFNCDQSDTEIAADVEIMQSSGPDEDYDGSDAEIIGKIKSLKDIERRYTNTNRSHADSSLLDTFSSLSSNKSNASSSNSGQGHSKRSSVSAESSSSDSSSDDGIYLNSDGFEFDQDDVYISNISGRNPSERDSDSVSFSQSENDISRTKSDYSKSGSDDDSDDVHDVDVSSSSRMNSDQSESEDDSSGRKGFHSNRIVPGTGLITHFPRKDSIFDRIRSEFPRLIDLTGVKIAGDTLADGKSTTTTTTTNPSSNPKSTQDWLNYDIFGLYDKIFGGREGSSISGQSASTGTSSSSNPGNPSPPPKPKLPPNPITEAFSNAEMMKVFTPTATFKVPIADLQGSSVQVFREMKPEVMAFMSFSDPTDKVIEFFESEKGIELLKALPIDGEKSCLEDLGIHFEVLSPKALSAFTSEMIMLVDPKYFEKLTLKQFMEIDPSLYLPDQVAELKIVKDIPVPFLEHLVMNTPDFFKGLTSSQLDELTEEQFKALPLDTVYLIHPEELHASSVALPDEYFKNLTRIPALELLFTKVTVDQVSLIPEMYEIEEENPFYGLYMNWASIGVDHEGVIGLLPLQAIELMEVTTLGSMPSGEFSLLREDVKEYISKEAFSCINPEAITPAELSHLVKINTKLCSALRPDHFWFIREESLALDPICVSMLPKLTWTYIVNNASDLRGDFLTKETGFHLENLGECFSLTARHWSRLGINHNQEAHPCSVLKFSDIKDNKEFWTGINMGCFLALDFIDRISVEQFKFVKLQNIPETTTKKFDEKVQELLKNETVVEQQVQDLRSLSYRECSELKDSHSQEFSDHNLLAEVTAELLSNLSPEFLSNLTAAQYKSINPEACNVLTKTQLSVIPLSNLSLDCISHIPPQQFAYFTLGQLRSIPAEVWMEGLYKSHIAMIHPDTLLDAVDFRILGLEIDPASPDHPCLAATEQHIIDLMSPQTRRSFMEHCGPVLDSQVLQSKGPLINA